jgi:ABC-type sugar transport system ATPase subunit
MPLRVILGLQPVHEGRIIDGQDVTGAAPKETNPGMILQNSALFAHLNAREIIALPKGLSVCTRPRCSRHILVMCPEPEQKLHSLHQGFVPRGKTLARRELPERFIFRRVLLGSRKPTTAPQAAS